LVVQVEPFLRRLVVIGGDRQQTRRAGRAHRLGEVNDLPRVVAAGPGEHGDPAGSFLDQDLDNPHAFGMTEGRVLTCRTARHEEMNAGVDLTAPQPSYRTLVELA
jgi:hypothetical protein